MQILEHGTISKRYCNNVPFLKLSVQQQLYLRLAKNFNISLYHWFLVLDSIVIISLTLLVSIFGSGNSIYACSYFWHACMPTSTRRQLGSVPITISEGRRLIDWKQT